MNINANADKIAKLQAEIKRLKVEGRQQSPAVGIGKVLRKHRLAAGLRSYRDVAIASEVSIAIVNRMERGELTNPTWHTLIRLAKAVSVPLDKFVAEMAKEEMK